MAQHAPYVPVEKSPAKKCLITLGTLGLFAVVSFLDFTTGKEFSFTLPYLATISISIWFVGPAPSLVLCFLAAASSMICESADGTNSSAVLWNAAGRLGIYLLFYVILAYLREHKPSAVRANRMRRWIAAAALLPFGALIGGAIIRSVSDDVGQRAVVVPASNAAPTVKAPWAELAALVEAAAKESRPILLGSRDPNGESCVVVSRTGDAHGTVLPTNLGDVDGGPGTSMAVLYFLDRQQIKSPLAEFKWHQTRLRRYLEYNLARGAEADELARRAAAKAKEFLGAADAWPGLPTNLIAIDCNGRDDWPSYCLASLDTAIRNKDLVEVRHWARELVAATFWLDDLLRWRGFLYRNLLVALDYQARCESVFTAAEALKTNYDYATTMSEFPAGVLGMNGVGNYHEVERQAEHLFSMSAERVVELEYHTHLTSGSVWMPPEARDEFLQLRSSLSPENQRTWDLAARTPYEHGYLVNILFRARTVQLVNDLRAVLKRFDACYPRATVNELMGVMMYRGHSFAGNEWGDRFQPQLAEAAATIPADQSDPAALRAARDWTHQFYRPENYGATFTLRDALDRRRLDCVRATDMIAAIFRNAGRTRMGHVRWCSETGGHSVAAYLGPDEPRSKPLLADGLTAPREPEVWPDCYFRRHAWPPGLESNRPPYAMELYARGIDSYVWAQGYIVRGANAGLLTTAPIPYTKQFGSDSTRKVYDGPYPE
jgi:hypothetical protein